MTTELIKPKDAAKLLNVSYITLRKLIDENQISYIDMGTGKYRLIRFKQEHLDRYLSKREHNVG